MSSTDLSPLQITAALAHLGSLLPSTPRAEMVQLFPSIQARGISPHAYASALEILCSMRPRNES